MVTAWAGSRSSAATPAMVAAMLACWGSRETALVPLPAWQPALISKVVACR
jgi:hypothetical protein